MGIRYFLGLIIFSIFLLNGCTNTSNSYEANSRRLNQDSLKLNLIGSYSGDLPCVDCDAITTLLKLDGNQTYKLIYKYEGKSEDEFIKEGDWLITDDYLVLQGIDYQYKIEPDYLQQLDLSGNEITGAIAEKYQLSKVK